MQSGGQLEAQQAKLSSVIRHHWPIASGIDPRCEDAVSWRIEDAVDNHLPVAARR
jgi:hypothetical protein